MKQLTMLIASAVLASCGARSSDEERVRELHGTMAIRSARGAGTTLTIRLPLQTRPTEVFRARAAG